jgi:hypothetical protein
MTQVLHVIARLLYTTSLRLCSALVGHHYVLRCIGSRADWPLSSLSLTVLAELLGQSAYIECQQPPIWITDSVRDPRAWKFSIGVRGHILPKSHLFRPAYALPKIRLDPSVKALLFLSGPKFLFPHKTKLACDMPQSHGLAQVRSHYLMSNVKWIILKYGTAGYEIRFELYLPFFSIPLPSGALTIVYELSIDVFTVTLPR